MTSHYQYTWLIWSSAFLIPWLALFIAFPRHRKAMWWTSIATASFRLTEPLFVSKYWNQASLFNLAQRTGFNIESLIFCFAIGGVGFVLYNIITGQRLEPLPPEEKAHPLHRHHKLVPASPFIVFVLLVWFPWNAIYHGIIAMAVGAAATIWCRPGLEWKSWIGGGLFLGYYIEALGDDGGRDRMDYAPPVLRQRFALTVSDPRHREVFVPELWLPRDSKASKAGWFPNA